MSFRPFPDLYSRCKAKTIIQTCYTQWHQLGAEEYCAVQMYVL